jgi:hypothetical protein
VETSKVWNFAGKFCGVFGKQGFGQGCFTGDVLTVNAETGGFFTF